MRFDPTGEISAALIVVVVICALAGGIMGAQFEGELEPETPQPEDYSKPKKHHLTPNNPNVQAEPNETHQDEKKLTTGDRIKNGIIGAGLGAAVGGAVMAFIGAGASVITGSATTYISALGGTGVQTFALGAAIYDIFAVIFSSLFGVEMEPIEIEP